MTISRCRGRSRLMFLRLCVRAPRMRMYSIANRCEGQPANILLFDRSLEELPGPDFCARSRALRPYGRIFRGARCLQSSNRLVGRTPMASVNKVILVGNLGRDPETRYTTGGDAVTNIRVATTDTWKDKNGEKQERTEWHTVVFFGRQAEIAGEYLKKGRQIYVEGRLQTRKWQDKEGQDKYTTEIVADRMQMLGSRAGAGGADAPERATSTAGAGRSAAPAKKNVDDLDDDIPF